MTSFSNLPDLVILGILKNVIADPGVSTNLISNLKYLAVCQQWRYLAMPQVYSHLFIYMANPRIDDDDDDDDDDDLVPGVYTNISLFPNNNCEKMVKKICIINHGENNFANIFEPILKVFDIYETCGLRNYADDQEFIDLDEYGSQKLDDEMFEKMVGILVKFRETFINVNYMYTHLRDGCGIARQFLGKIVELYSEQLTSLIHSTYPLLDLPCFPPNLTELAYVLNGHSFLDTPKINVQDLEILALDDLPVDFSWQQTCGGLEFPCLKTLKVKYVSETVQRMRDVRATELEINLDYSIIQREPLELPLVDTLYLKNFEEHVGDFNVKKLPCHLNKLYFCGKVGKLDILSKLPIKSINDVSMSLSDEISDPNQFYRITNRFLGEGIKNCQKCYLQYNSSASDIDFERTEWVNVKEIYITYQNTNVLVTELAAMPQLERMSMSVLEYVDEDIDWDMLANSKLQDLEIPECQHVDAEDDIIEYLVKLFKSLKCLKYASIPSDVYEELTEKLEIAKKESKHLENIELEYSEEH